MVSSGIFNKNLNMFEIILLKFKLLNDCEMVKGNLINVKFCNVIISGKSIWLLGFVNYMYV